MTLRGAGSIGTKCGTATTYAPAAVAEATPVAESSSTIDSLISTSNFSAAKRYGSGKGLLLVTSEADIEN